MKLQIFKINEPFRNEEQIKEMYGKELSCFENEYSRYRHYSVEENYKRMVDRSGTYKIYDNDIFIGLAFYGIKFGGDEVNMEILPYLEEAMNNSNWKDKVYESRYKKIETKMLELFRLQGINEVCIWIEPDNETLRMQLRMMNYQYMDSSDDGEIENPISLNIYNKFLY